MRMQQELSMKERFNQLGYEMVPIEVRDKIFGPNTPKNTIPVSRKLACENHIQSFGFNLPPSPSGHPWPANLVLPNLKGRDLEEHFEAIALEQLGDVPSLAQQFVDCDLPPLPPRLTLQLNPGWTRYSQGPKGWEVTSVPYPMEKVFTFDTETFVQGGSYPIIGTAVSPEACYLWLAPEFVNPTLPQEEWSQYNMVPVGTDRLIIAHNASYDRIRTQEAYSLDKEVENYWLDTLSMHIATCGLAAGQRWLYVLANKDPELLTDEEKRRLRYKPQWLGKGATNSLVECYNFHVYEARKWNGDGAAHRMELSDKAIRDVFVKASTLQEFQPLIIDLIYYALKDSWYTAELFQYLYPRYRDSTPSATALMGHFYLAASHVPANERWYEWIDQTETKFNELVSEMSAISRRLLDREVNQWIELFNEERSTLTTKEIKVLVKEGNIWSLFPKLSQWVNSDPWRNQLDWRPKVIGNSKLFPEWKGKVLPEWCHKMIMDSSQDIGVKTRTAHLLLKLKWKDSPIVHTSDRGWTYWDKELNTMSQIPHPKRPGENVGGLLSKDFIKDAEVGRLSSDLDEAKRALEIANAISYWTSVRNRVMERYAVLVENPYGKPCRLMAPSIVPHGTSTRRVVEPLFATMCSTKNWRIGTELKTRIEAPDGWKIVGGDYDSEEMRIAAGYADKWEGGIIGGSPLGYQVLSGSKESGTDSHTKITRDTFPEFFEGIIFDEGLGMCEEVD